MEKIKYCDLGLHNEPSWSLEKLRYLCISRELKISQTNKKRGPIFPPFSDKHQNKIRQIPLNSLESGLILKR